MLDVMGVDKTLVVTTGIQGSALQINRDENSLLFIHDRNGNTVGKCQNNPPSGDLSLRIEYPTYEKEFRALSEDLLPKVAKQQHRGHLQMSFITLYRNKRWEVHMSGGLWPVYNLSSQLLPKAYPFVQYCGPLSNPRLLFTARDKQPTQRKKDAALSLVNNSEHKVPKIVAKEKGAEPV